MSGSRRSPATAVAAVALLVLGIVTAGYLVVRSGAVGSAPCRRSMTLQVATTPHIAGPLGAIAAGYTKSKPTVAGTCVTVNITAAPTETTMAALSNGWSDPGAGPLPDVWVPESTAWPALARANAPAARLVPDGGVTIASSPTVIATPRTMATTLGWPTAQFTWSRMITAEKDPTFWARAGHSEWGPFTVGFTDPADSTASLSEIVGLAGLAQKTPVTALSTQSFLRDRVVQLAILNLERSSTVIPATQKAMTKDLYQADTSGRALTYLSAIPMQESDVVAYNRGVDSPTGQPPQVGLVASYPSDGLFLASIPYVTLKLTAGDPVRSLAAADFLRAVRGDAGKAFMAAGFRTPDGTNPALTPAIGTVTTLPATTEPVTGSAVLAAAQTAFHRVHQRGSTLAVLDVSGSMGDTVPGTTDSKLTVAVDACVAALPLFAPDDQVGLWEFATHLDNGQNYKELSPTIAMDAPGTATPTHVNDLRLLVPTLRPGGDTALYQTTLAAFREKTRTYVPGRLNQVVLLTDGQNDDPGDPDQMTLADLVKTLMNEFNAARPVHVITIAYGTEADTTALHAISAATQSNSYVSRDPRDIFNVFIDAVSEAGS